jgi:aconitate hydratase
MRYKQEGVGLVIVAGKEYGSGSSRDWAAKGVALLGVKAVIAQSYERIHRSNLLGMGVLPLEFLPGESRETLGLTGAESYFVTGVRQSLEGSRRAVVRAVAADGSEKTFDVTVRVDTPREADYFRSGGILPYVLRQIAKNSSPQRRGPGGAPGSSE